MFNIPGVLFGFCYIPTSHSHYYTWSAFSYMEEKLSEFQHNGYVILGDMNVRFGKNVKELMVPFNASDKDSVSYPIIADDIGVPNDNAVLLSVVCNENSMVVVNNLKYQRKHFLGKRTFRRQGTRRSQRLTYVWHRVLWLSILMIFLSYNASTYCTIRPRPHNTDCRQHWCGPR